MVTVDVQSTQKELAYILNDARPEVIFTSVAKKEFVEEALAQNTAYPHVILTPQEIDLSKLESYPIESLTITDPEQTLSILYTSGTTGSPKGVMLSHKNIMQNVVAVVDQIPIINGTSNVMVLLPLHHSLPLIGSVFAPIYAGSTLHFADGLNAESIIRTLNDGKISLIIGVPRLYETLAKGIMAKINASMAAKVLLKLAGLLKSKSFSKTVFKSVHQKFGGHIEYLVCGGAALPDSVGKVFEALGFEVLVGYGLTECAPMISFTRPGECRIGYSGRLLPELELKIIPDTGEIAVRGPNVMQGYYNRPEETAQIIREDGWLYTGDIGTLDKYGLKITGRIKEIIVTSNGKNINPVEIEHQLIKDTTYINEVAVFLHDDMLHALIYPDMGAVRIETGADLEELIKEEILNYNRNAMSYKRIKQFHISSEEIPKTRLGKTQRYKLEAFINKKDKVQEEEKLDQFSQTYLIIKDFVDKETGKKARSNDHFEIDLNLDSLGRVSLIAFIETAFDVSLAENQLDELCTLEKLAEHVEKHATMQQQSEVSWGEILRAKVKDFNMPKSGFLHWFSIHFLKIFFAIFFRFRTQGREYLSNEPCIIIGNHRSGFDGAFVVAKMKWSAVKKTFFFAKNKHFKSRWLKFMAKRNNVILMDINENIRTSLQTMAEVLKQGNNVVIFPEGTRSKDKQLKKFKEAYAILSVELNVPIQPVLLTGSEKAAYGSSRLPRLGNKINMQVLPLVRPQEGETSTQLNERVEKLYANI